jgi:alpha-tubulin suppressor-like RCC1 family protein
VALANGEVACWGQPAGATPLDDVLVPQRVPGLADIVALAGGWYHVCALRSDGTVLCWGDNGSNQLGDGTTEARDTPAPTG